jgi:hypothetical protein
MLSDFRRFLKSVACRFCCHECCIVTTPQQQSAATASYATFTANPGDIIAIRLPCAAYACHAASMDELCELIRCSAGEQITKPIAAGTILTLFNVIESQMFASTRQMLACCLTSSGEVITIVVNEDELIA